jgi:hypothetical protein
MALDLNPPTSTSQVSGPQVVPPHPGQDFLFLVWKNIKEKTSKCHKVLDVNLSHSGLPWQQTFPSHFSSDADFFFFNEPQFSCVQSKLLTLSHYFEISGWPNLISMKGKYCSTQVSIFSTLAGRTLWYELETARAWHSWRQTWWLPESSDFWPGIAHFINRKWEAGTAVMVSHKTNLSIIKK